MVAAVFTNEILWGKLAQEKCELLSQISKDVLKIFYQVGQNIGKMVLDITTFSIMKMHNDSVKQKVKLYELVSQLSCYTECRHAEWPYS
jgi:hypothetical protein